MIIDEDDLRLLFMAVAIREAVDRERKATEFRKAELNKQAEKMIAEIARLKEQNDRDEAEIERMKAETHRIRTLWAIRL